MMFRDKYQKLSRDELLDEIDLLVDLKQSERIEKILSSLDCMGENLTALVEGQGVIMSVLSDFAEKQNAFSDKQEAALTDLGGDIQTLNDKITELQNTSGAITPEDQALLDAIQARSQVITDRVDALAALTPPVVPA